MKIAGEWPTEVTEDVAIAKLQQCLEGHPKFVLAIREFLQKPTNRVTYLPGNHDLEFWFSVYRSSFFATWHQATPRSACTS